MSDLDDFVPYAIRPRVVLREVEPPPPDPRVTIATMYAESVVFVAEGYVGTRELGTNAGPVVERMLRTVGLRRGAPWCAAAVATILHEAADNIGLVSTCPRGLLAASATKLWRYALRHPERATAITDASLMRAGDVGVMVSDAKRRRDVQDRGSLAKGHTWIAGSDSQDVLGGHVSLEGNTSRVGVREGQGFYRRSRPGYDDARFVGWVRFQALA